MSLSDLSIRRPVFAWMLMASMMIFGYLSLKEMGVSQLPDVDFPIVSISVTYEGAAPEVMELDVIDPIESAVLSIEGIKSISSQAKMGVASISIEFNLQKDINVAVAEVEAKINQAQRSLPKEISRPTISKANPDDRPIMWLSVTSTKMTSQELMSFVRDQLKDQFQTVSGVADVFLGGHVEPNLRVWVDNEKLMKYSLSVTDILSAISSEHRETPSGYIEDETSEKNVRILGEATSVEEFSKLPIIRRGGAPNFVPLFLGDVAQVREGHADIRRISRSNGHPAVGLGIRKQRGSNAVDVAKGAKEKIKILQKNLPPGLEIGVNFDSTTFIEDSIHELSFTMGLSAILTAIVCWLFLGSLTATINVILAIPTSILGSFIILKSMGFTLNMFTLLGLSLSIGIVVDDAIMVLENIYRHFESGKNKMQASLEGANEISFAALSATVAIMAIFLPVAFMEGLIGKYFFQFGITISVAVGLSYIEAITLTPMRTSQFIEDKTQRSKIGQMVDRFFDKVMDLYTKVLHTALNHRWMVIFFSIIFFLTSLLLVKKLPKEFVPSQDISSFMVRIKAKEGSSLSFTDQATKEVEQYFKSRGETKRFFAAIGGFGGQGGGESNISNMFVTLHPPSDRPKDPALGRAKTQAELLEEYRAYFKNNFKKAIVFIQDTSQGGLASSGRGFPVEFTLTGGDWEKLITAAKMTMKEMKESELYTDVDTDYKESVTEIKIFPNRERAKLYGVSVQEIGTTINALIGGTVVGKYSKDGHRNDIRVKMTQSSHSKKEDLENIFVRNTRGELIRLVDVVSIKELPGAQTISRRQRQRAITIFSGVVSGKSQGEAIEQAKVIARKHLPPGYMIVESGSSQSFKETFQGLIFALGMGILMAYMILGAQFNSFVDPITVLIALPFSFSGAFLGLWLTDQSLNMYSMIGLILLMGIVKKNSILLVDFTHKKREEGFEVSKALKLACPNRLRPILMTTFSTTAGAIPLALSLGPGSESLRPMAIAIIGGSLVSTLLTLVVVPALYLILAKKKNS